MEIALHGGVSCINFNIYGLVMREVKLALKAIAWRKVGEVWREEAMQGTIKTGNDWKVNGL